MKKIFATLAVIAAIVCTSACGNRAAQKANDEAVVDSVEVLAAPADTLATPADTVVVE